MTEVNTEKEIKAAISRLSFLLNRGSDDPRFFLSKALLEIRLARLKERLETLKKKIKEEHPNWWTWRREE
jgi:hypothetical protein